MESWKILSPIASRENVETEVFSLKRDLKSIRVFRNEVAEAQDAIESGIAIRVVKDGGTGFSVTNMLGHDQLERTFKSALRMAKSSKKPSNCGQLPQNSENSRQSAPLNIYDNELSSLSPEEVTSLVLRMSECVSSCNEAKCFFTGVLMVLMEEFSIFNSHGLEHLSERNSILHSRIIVEARKDTRHSTGTNQFSSRRLSEFEPEKEASNAVTKATEKVELPAKTIPSGKYDLILTPEAVGAFLCYLISPMITGKSIQLGVSCFADMLDKAVAAECFSLLDDGRARGGLGSAMTDDEGTVTRSTTIIEKGVLKNFLYDTPTACAIGTVSTGNARRLSETLGRTYLAPPEPLPTNLIVKNGDFSFEELVGETERGVLIDAVDYTFPLVPERGYFTMRSSFSESVIEKGQTVGHAENVAFQGELRGILAKICGIGRDARQSIHIGSLAASCPHVKMRDVAFVKSG